MMDNAFNFHHDSCPTQEGLMRGRIVEVEAYDGPLDRAAHSCYISPLSLSMHSQHIAWCLCLITSRHSDDFKRTPKNESMYKVRSSLTAS